MHISTRNLIIISTFLIFGSVLIEAQTCRNRCGPFSSSRTCQCNSACANFGDCCNDYGAYCNTDGSSRTQQPIARGDISRLARSLWTADIHRVPGWQYTLNKQSNLRHVYRRRDSSPRPLFASLEPSSLHGPTITPFRALLNNYERTTGVAEVVTAAEEAEVNAFLDALLATDVMNQTYNFLNQKGYFLTREEFRSYLETTWFGLYSRSRGTFDTSAFEHTFVGEMKNGAVKGFHNWLQFFLQESAGNLNYYGYTREAQPNQLLVQFNWSGQVKTLSSIMVGVSPEFEMALFTVCYLAQPHSRCPFTLNGHDMSIQTWTLGNHLGAAYFHIV